MLESEQNIQPDVSLLSKQKEYLTKNCFFFVVIYIIVAFARPTDTIPPIRALKPAFLSVIILTYFAIRYNFLIDKNIKQLNYFKYWLLLMVVYLPFALIWSRVKMEVQEMLLTLPFMISVAASICNFKRLEKFFFLLIILAVYQASYALLHGGRGTGSIMGDENDLALYLNMWIPFCYFHFLKEKKKIKKIMYSIFLVILLAGVVVTSSRGGFVGLVCTFFIIWIVTPNKLRNMIIVLLIALIGLQFVSEEYKADMATTTDMTESTADERLESWTAAWKMFKDYPLGVGPGNFPMHFPYYQGERMRHNMWGRMAHSLWFTLIPELGIPGMILYIFIMIKNFQASFFILKISKSIPGKSGIYFEYLSYSFIAGMVTFFISGTFVSVLYYPHYWFLSIFIGISKSIAIQEFNIINENKTI